MVEIPEILVAEFERRLIAASSLPLAPGVTRALHAHYQELRRWSPTLALIGPGVVGELFERHYAESLAAQPLLPEGPLKLLDVGSGAGFPGLILAALRPDLEVTLTEARQRKWAFLVAACRRARLSCRCLNVRVSPSTAAQLPEDISVVTARAVRVDLPAWEALIPRLLPGARALFWSGDEVLAPPPPFREGRTVRLPGDRRWIREYCWLGNR